MIRYGKWIASGVSASLLATVLFSVRSFDVSQQPEIIDNVIHPVLSYHCAEYAAAKPLDMDGYLTITVWNIYKQQKDNWRSALNQYAKTSELILLQEAKLTSDLSEYLHQSHWQVTMANAFKFQNTSAGVMNLSTVKSLSTCAYLAMEPWLRLPKSALLAEYALSDGQTLAVVNLHGVNFAWGLNDYKAQLTALEAVLSQHTGPIILAGDFNTWRKARLNVVHQFARDLRLSEVVLGQDQRLRVFGQPLDHVYYRGLEMIKAEAPKTDASDHNPIIVDFKVLTSLKANQ